MAFKMVILSREKSQVKHIPKRIAAKLEEEKGTSQSCQGDMRGYIFATHI